MGLLKKPLTGYVSKATRITSYVNEIQMMFRHYHRLTKWSGLDDIDAVVKQTPLGPIRRWRVKRLLDALPYGCNRVDLMGVLADRGYISYVDANRYLCLNHPNNIYKRDRLCPR